MQQLDLFAAFEDNQQEHAVKSTPVAEALTITADEETLSEPGNKAENILTSDEIIAVENISEEPALSDDENIITPPEVLDEIITDKEFLNEAENEDDNTPIPEEITEAIITEENVFEEPGIPEDENIQATGEAQAEEIISDSIEKQEPVIAKIKEAKTTTNKRGRMSFKEMDADLVMVEVPEDAILFQKQYYGMREVAKWFHVNQSLLRYWENEFDILKPRKTRKGDRLFRPEDIKNLELIYFLLRQRKFSIEGAKQYLKENKQKADIHMQLIQSLTKFRGFLLEWKAILGA